MPWWCRQFLGSLLLAGLLATDPASAQSAPRRVASVNLCSDQLLLALADRSQVASLSRLARDPELSFMADEAAGFRMSDGGAEILLFDRPDLVLAGTYGQQEQAALLKRQGLEVLSFGSWSSLAEGREQIRALARRLGHPERGEGLVARIDEALERARGIVSGRRNVLIYERGGWVAAARSPLGEILTHMGFRLHQEALGLAAGGAVRLEAIVAAPPDFLLVDADSEQVRDIGTALFVHPALADAVPRERRLAVPTRLTICGGPATPAAIDALRAEVAAKVR